MGATLLVQPLDLLKNRMQLSSSAGKKESHSSFYVLRNIIRNEGFFAIYDGLSAGLLRQATYTTTRLGIYTWLFEKFTKLVSFEQMENYFHALFFRSTVKILIVEFLLALFSEILRN